MATEALDAEQIGVLLVLFEPFRGLADVTDRPRPEHDLSGDVLDFVVIEVFAESEFVGEFRHDDPVSLRVVPRRDRLIPPLQLSAGVRDAAGLLEVGCCG